MAVILLAALGLNTYHLEWGLPDGGQSAWAADSYGPLKVLGIAYRSFREWNSGWFYFKHPLGYPLLLALVYAPYLAWLRFSGQWRHPLPDYPYGFADPDGVLWTLAIIGRASSVAFTLGTVALAYVVGKRLAGRDAGRLAACLVATGYPFVYYAHTTNLDAAYVFWLVLALYAAIRASESGRAAPWCWLGLAAAMAVSTKEQGAGFVLPLPLLALTVRMRAMRSLRPCWGREVRWMAVVALIVAALANNVLYNPSGFVRRVAFMMGHPLQPVNRALLPVEFAWFKGAQEWIYLRQVWSGIESAYGLPLMVVIVAGFIAVLWCQPRGALWLLLPALSLHYFGLRGMVIAPDEPTLVVTVRYLMPIMVVAAVAAGAGLAELVARCRNHPARFLVYGASAGLVGFGLARAVELNLLLSGDPRYEAEAWMRANVAEGATIEIYQDRVHLPRFQGRWSVRRVPMEQRSIAHLEQRAPDFIILSSASRASITHARTRDWRETRTWVRPVPSAVQLYRALTDGGLGYRPVAELERRPRLFRSQITSLSPTITIYARQPSP